MENTAEPQQETAVPDEDATLVASNNTKAVKKAAKWIFVSHDLMQEILELCDNVMIYYYGALELEQERNDAPPVATQESGKLAIEAAEKKLARVKTTAINLIHQEPCISILYLSLSMYRDYQQQKSKKRIEELKHCDDVYDRCRERTSTMEDFGFLHKCVRKVKKERWITHKLLKDVRKLIGFIARSDPECLLIYNEEQELREERARKEEIERLDNFIEMLETAQEKEEESGGEKEEEEEDVIPVETEM